MFDHDRPELNRMPASGAVPGAPPFIGETRHDLLYSRTGVRTPLL